MLLRVPDAAVQGLDRHLKNSRISLFKTSVRFEWAIFFYSIAKE